jgi:hypothetical protein
VRILEALPACLSRTAPVGLEEEPELAAAERRPPATPAARPRVSADSPGTLLELRFDGLSTASLSRWYLRRGHLRNERVGSARPSIIFRADREEIWAFHGDGTYSVLDRQSRTATWTSARALAERDRGTQLEGAGEHAVGERLAALARQRTDTASLPAWRKVGEDEVHGIRAMRYAGELPDGARQELWLAAAGDLPLDEADLAGITAMRSLVTDYPERLDGLASPFYYFFSGDGAGAPAGTPVKWVRTAPGRARLAIEVLRIERRPLAGDLFELPAGARRRFGH